MTFNVSSVKAAAATKETCRHLKAGFICRPLDFCSVRCRSEWVREVIPVASRGKRVLGRAEDTLSYVKCLEQMQAQ